MYLLALYLVLSLSPGLLLAQEQVEHRDFQYNSVVDPATGRYNFAYDTGNDNDIAHSMHMQYRDINGIVRGRYGYTDPRGKLRVVEYEAGPQGFVARGDVGPDQSLHEQTPEAGPQSAASQSASYVQNEDLNLSPRPVQMAGWDPEKNPMGQPIVDALERSFGTDIAVSDIDGYSTSNATKSDDELGSYVPVLNPYDDDRYPRVVISTNENSGGRELESSPTQTSDDQIKPDGEPYPVAPPTNVNNIDVDPDEIRESASGQRPIVTVARSTDSSSGRSSSSSSSRPLPYSYRNYYSYPSTHDHYGDIASPYRSVYIPSHGHYHYLRQPHDHEAERRYYINRRTHDHDAERRYYVSRYTHDHDAERRYYANRHYHDHDAEKPAIVRRKYVVSSNNNNRQTHDHDAERRYYANRQTHDHDAEKYGYYHYDGLTGYHYHRNNPRYYHDTVYHQNNPDRRRIYYRDNHSDVPHEHYGDIYHNGRDYSHSHSDVHLYGTTTATSQNLEVPPTAKPGQLKYISSDKYHDKYYFWGD